MITNTRYLTTSACRVRSMLAACALLGLATSTVHAQWSVTPYVWATGVDATVSLDGRPLVDEHIPFSELIDDVTLAAMVRVEAQYGSYGGMLDLFYVEMATSGSQHSLPSGTPATVGSEIGMAVIDATGSYAPRADGSGFALFAGTRILAAHSEVELEATTGPGTTVTQQIETSDILLNALLGVMYRERLARRWSIDARADVGTGETELTWSAGAELAYAFGATHRYAISVGYRHMAIEYEEDAPVHVSMAMSGLVTGLRFAF